MRYPRHFCAAAVLTLVLAFPAVSGEMGFPISSPPEPPPPQQSVTAGEMGFPVTAMDEIDPWTGIASSLINVLSAF